MFSYPSIRVRPTRVVARAVLAFFAVVGMIACSDASAPRSAVLSVRITPVADSAFEGDVIRLTATLVNESGAEASGAPVTWTVSDTALAKSAGDGRFALLRPGTERITARIGAVTGTYDLVIGRLAVKRVELTPATMSLGRGDRLQVSARILGQGDRVITGRSVAFTSDDSLVAVIGSPGNVIGGPGFLIATGPGSTTIRATVDGVTGSAHAGVVIADTTFALSQYNGSPLPVLIAADTVMFNGVPEFDEVYAESGTMVLSGLMQLRYQLDVRYSQYHVIRTGNTISRELRFQQREFDRGVATAGANGNLAMTSEFIFPLDHTAAVQSDGFQVHFRIAGSDSFLDLRYRRQAP